MRTASIIGIILFAAALRMYFLFTTEHGLDMDECYVGVMVRHVAEGQPFERAQGVAYGNGNLVIANVLGRIGRYTGVNDILVNSMTVLSSIVIVLLTIYLFTLWTDAATGLLTGLLLAFFPPYLKLSFQTYGYMEAMLLALVGVLAFSVIVRAPSGGNDGERRAMFPAARLAAFTVLGLSTGVALWFSEYTVVFLIPMALIGLLRIRKFGIAGVLIAAVSFLIGYSEQLRTMIYTRAGAGSFSGWVMYGGFGSYKCIVRNLVEIYLPRFLSLQIYQYHAGVAAHGIVLFWLLAASFVFLSLRLAFVKGESVMEDRAAMLVFLLFPLYFVCMLALFKWGTYFGRYFLPAAPFLVFIIAAAIVRLYRWGGAARYLAAAALVVAIGCQALGVQDMHRCGYGMCVDTKGYMNLIAFLKEKKVHGIYTNYDTKWHVAFYSGEEIVGSDHMYDVMPRYVPYDIKVRAMKHPGFVFPEGTRFAWSLDEYLKKEKIPYEKKTIAGLTVFYDIGRPLGPVEWLRPVR